MATVNELIEILQQAAAQGHGDLNVMASYNYGDYWHTTVAISLDEFEVKSVQHSAYHEMDKVLDEDEVYEEDGTRKADEEIRDVVMLG